MIQKEFLSSFNYQPFSSKTQTTTILNPYGSKNSANGVLGGIRTHDLTIRNHTLYPAELQGHFIRKQEAYHLLISPLLSGSNLLAFFNFLFKDFAGFEFRHSFIFGFISFIASWNFTLFAFLLCGFKFAKTNQLHAFTLA